MSGRFTKRAKMEAAPSYFLMRKKKGYSQGYGKRKYYKSVARTRGALFASPEIKYYDFISNGNIAVPVCGVTNLGANTDTTPLTSGTCFAPVLGNDITNRIGRKCAVTKIRIRGQIGIAAQTAFATPDNFCKARMVLFIDKQANSARATLADVFQTNATSISTPQAINVPQNLASLGRFRVLKDKFITLSNPGITGSPTATDCIQNSLVKDFKISIKFRKPIIVDFNATNGGTFADIVRNSINIQFVCHNNTLTPLVAYYGRIAYSDV